jgi:hypothetical protein
MLSVISVMQVQYRAARDHSRCTYLLTGYECQVQVQTRNVSVMALQCAAVEWIVVMVKHSDSGISGRKAETRTYTGRGHGRDVMAPDSMLHMLRTFARETAG